MDRAITIVMISTSRSSASTTIPVSFSEFCAPCCSESACAVAEVSSLPSTFRIAPSVNDMSLIPGLRAADPVQRLAADDGVLFDRQRGVDIGPRDGVVVLLLLTERGRQARRGDIGGQVDSHLLEGGQVARLARLRAGESGQGTELELPLGQPRVEHGTLL